WTVRGCPQSVSQGEVLFRKGVMVMRQIIVLLAGFLLTLGVTAGVGFAVAQKDATGKGGGDKPGFAGGKYPGAKGLCSGQGAGGYHAVLATTDALDKVEAFYQKQTGEKLKPDQPGGHGIGGGAGEFRVYQDDSIQPGVRGGPRPVVLRILVQRTKGHDLTLVV